MGKQVAGGKKKGSMTAAAGRSEYITKKSTPAPNTSAYSGGSAYVAKDTSKGKSNSDRVRLGAKDASLALLSQLAKEQHTRRSLEAIGTKIQLSNPINPQQVRYPLEALGEEQLFVASVALREVVKVHSRIKDTFAQFASRESPASAGTNAGAADEDPAAAFTMTAIERDLVATAAEAINAAVPLSDPLSFVRVSDTVLMDTVLKRIVSLKRSLGLSRQLRACKTSMMAENLLHTRVTPWPASMLTSAGRSVAGVDATALTVIRTCVAAASGTLDVPALKIVNGGFTARGDERQVLLRHVLKQTERFGLPPHLRTAKLSASIVDGAVGSTTGNTVPHPIASAQSFYPSPLDLPADVYTPKQHQLQTLQEEIAELVDQHTKWTFVIGEADQILPLLVADTLSPNRSQRNTASACYATSNWSPFTFVDETVAKKQRKLDNIVVKAEREEEGDTTEAKSSMFQCRHVKGVEGIDCCDGQAHEEANATVEWLFNPKCCCTAVQRDAATQEERNEGGSRRKTNSSSGASASLYGLLCGELTNGAGKQGEQYVAAVVELGG